MNKELIIKEIKKHLGISKDGDFAEFLGINQNTLSSWKSRDSINYELIVIKCKDIDANWLITGEGPMLKTVTAQTTEEPEIEYQRKIALRSLTESVTGVKMGEDTTKEADSLREEIKQLKTELRLNSLKWDKRAQLLEELMQTGFEKMAEALAQHLGAVQKDGNKASGAPVRKK